MWPFKNDKKLNRLRPGESAYAGGFIPKDADKAVITIDYDDEFGNKYQTLCTLDFKQRKIIKQEYRIIKKVKDIADNIPKLTINEDSIQWPDIR